MYKNKFCVGTVHLTALFKILETCPSSSHVKQLLEGMQQNKHQNKSQSACIVSEDVVQHFNKNAELETIFRVNSLCKLNHAHAVQSVEVYSQSSRIAILSQMSRVLIDISCQIKWCLLHKECHNYILISKCRWLGPCAS